MQLLALCALGLVATAAASDADSCFLLNGATSAKPFPSLTQCYKQNQRACCVSAHDETIGNVYGGLLSGTCVREFEALEQYYCLGCSPYADNFINWYNSTTGSTDGTYKAQPEGTHSINSYAFQAEANFGMVSNQLTTVPGMLGEIKLCKSFAEKLLYKDAAADATQVDVYDHCGLMNSDGNGELSRTIFALGDGDKDAAGGAKPLKDVLDATYYGTVPNSDPEATPVATALAAAIHAKQTTVKISHQWKFFATMRPPYYEADKFEISWYHTPIQDADGPGCFGAASGLQVASMSAALVAFVAHMLA